MFSFRRSWIGLVQTQGKRSITYFADNTPKTVATLNGPRIQMRMHVAQQMVSFSYSIDDGRTFIAVGSPQRFYFTYWKAARPALFSFNTLADASMKGSVDFDWVHCKPAPEDFIRDSAHR